ncbi:hypothetical protein GSI_14699 [Ganoderma sinense ZZ0214-1]|uniref:Uncharacterized protein n=1 Tax=Ganoderma sinense ZZ0214-1 TaxID=1077348 RepID=A0A2G8RPW9_9APHY|nr:hypothetical protein GSI_14699 [Ganoderma sinense ZZ0214-1]
MSFAPQMHGSFSANAGGNAFGSQFSTFSDSSFMDMSEESAKKIATLQAKLDKRLGPEYISQRPGPGGGPKLTYAEGWKIINLANEVFGFNGWSSTVVNITIDFIDFNEESRRFNVGVTAIVRVTLRDGVFHEDVGYGLLENSKSKGAALDKCKKEAVTDAVKRSLRNFGNLLGNCLYDKAYTQEVVKIKVPPPKFDRADLHRRPEFDETKANFSNLPQTSTSSAPLHNSSSSASSSSVAGSFHPIAKPEPASTMLPPPAPFHRPNAVSTPNGKGKEAEPQRRPPSNVGGIAQRTAERHAARLKAIQEAQEAQLREDEAARAAAAVSSSTSASVSAEAAPHAAASTTTDSQEDEYHFPSDDDALYATVDLDGLDDGVGRPIDFEEGAGAATEETASAGMTAAMDVPICDTAPAARPNWLQTSGGSSTIQRAPADHQNAAANASAPTSNSAGPRPQTSHTNVHQGAAHSRPGTSSMSGANGERARTPSMGGGFSFPAAPQQQPSRGQQPRPSGSSSSGSNLKRTADIMQGLQSARRGQQGMGLQNPPNGSGTSGHQPGNGPMREPFLPLEVGEGGDVKRMRRA